MASPKLDRFLSSAVRGLPSIDPQAALDVVVVPTTPGLAPQAKTVTDRHATAPARIQNAQVRAQVRIGDLVRLAEDDSIGAIRLARIHTANHF